MRQRGQASVEVVALIAAVLAVAAAVLLGVARFAPSLAPALGRALTGVIAPGTPTAPGLDGLESALLAAATSPDPDGPTLLDVRTHLRSRLGRPAGDAAFDAILRPLVDRALPSDVAQDRVVSIGVADTATEAAWIRGQLQPGWAKRAAAIAIGAAGPPGAVYSLLDAFGLAGSDPPDGIAPAAAAGDVVVTLDRRRVLVLRRRPGSGLAVISDTTNVLPGAR